MYVLNCVSAGGHPNFTKISIIADEVMYCRTLYRCNRNLSELTLEGVALLIFFLASSGTMKQSPRIATCSLGNNFVLGQRSDLYI